MVPGLDSERVVRHLQDVSSTLRVLETLQQIPYEAFAADPRTYWAVEKGLERCIQNVLDISAHVLASLGGPVPDDYGRLLVELGKRRIVPEEFARRVAPMAGFRNILVHEYLEIDLHEVYDALQNRLDDFRAFADYVMRFLEANVD